MHPLQRRQSVEQVRRHMKAGRDEHRRLAAHGLLEGVDAGVELLRAAP
jgi:hypothetical protein